jgi:uncharacterized ferredoxin-like protein
MAMAATTAPKAKDEDFLQVKLLKGPELKKLAKAIVFFGEKVKKKDLDRDRKNVENSQAVFFIGLKNVQQEKISNSIDDTGQSQVTSV